MPVIIAVVASKAAIIALLRLLRVAAAVLVAPVMPAHSVNRSYRRQFSFAEAPSYSSLRVGFQNIQFLLIFLYGRNNCR
jgi:flagellar biosynthesis protein FliR